MTYTRNKPASTQQLSCPPRVTPTRYSVTYLQWTVEYSLALQLPGTTPVPFVYPGRVWVAPVSVAQYSHTNSLLTAFVSEDPATVGRDGATTSHRPHHLRSRSFGMRRREQRCSECH